MQLLIFSLLIAFLFALSAGPFLIPLLHRLRFGQYIRAEGPKSHKKKEGTPTMGGLLIYASTLVACVILIRDWNSNAWLCILSMVGFGVVGFLDDYLKVVQRHNDGLSPKLKMLLLILVALPVAWFSFRNNGSVLQIPFFPGVTWDIGWFYLPLAVFVLIAAPNSVNLTDGLDGLAGGLSFEFFAVFSLILFSTTGISTDTTLLIFCGALTGALLGYLRFNVYPARLIMGDTGSLGLGGAMAAVCLLSGKLLWIIIMAAPFIASTVSCIIQTTYFRATKGKRFFRMAPLHHHFELMGYPETRIVNMYMIVGAGCALLGLLACGA